jgi:hypothetical protein
VNGDARGSNSAPWYREPWPWILMALPACAVIAGLVTLWIATESADELVADDYYKRGLAINQDLARAQRAAALGLGARLHSDGAVVRVELTGFEAGAPPDEIRLILSHPTRAELDRTIVLERGPTGYAAAWNPVSPGRWMAAIEDIGRGWRLSAVIHLPSDGWLDVGPPSGAGNRTRDEGQRE